MLAVSHFERGLAALEQAAEASSLLEQALRAGWGTMTLGKVLSSLALLLACLAAVRLLTALAGRLLGRTTVDARTRGYILKGTRTALYLFAALVFAGSLGIDVTSLIALVSVFGLAVSLAIQDILSNVAAGIELLLAKPFALGDYVATEDAEGEVAEITLTHTKLDTFGGQKNRQFHRAGNPPGGTKRLRLLRRQRGGGPRRLPPRNLPCGKCPFGPSAPGGGLRLRQQHGGVPGPGLGGDEVLLGCS